MPPSDPRSPASPTGSEKPEDPRDMMPTERKSMWRTAEERRMSDLTRVVEWLERRQGKRDQAAQKRALMVPSRKAKVKEEKKAKLTQKQEKQSHHVSFSEKEPEVTSRRDRDAVTYRRLYGVEAKGKRLSMVPGSYIKDGPGKSDLEIRDPVIQESSQRSMPFSRQSMAETVLQDPTFVGRRSTLLRDWVGKIPDAAYERRLKSLIDKGLESKVEILRILKPEEVLSCRYLRLSPNNIRTLVKLCKDAGMSVDIHPHMIEAEIDAKKVFSQTSTVAL
ncbi:uncharacterized protein C16orf78 homolog [Sturnira hondurensis]|uniref:uncharacterized protein C16orf78 homolog n=1 Tax=Sturnira hondurensis TaxID=192404 RepID=UPI001879F6BD|nr:uncharacterized protein C16orf78 homolog [Sturnira hondurensis]